MNTRFKVWMNVTLFAVVIALLTPSGVLAQDDNDAQSEDIVYMADGRELHGQIISETSREVIFQYIDRKLNLRSKLTLARRDIERIDRDVLIEVAIEPKARRTTARNAKASKPADSWSGYGRFRANSNAKNVPTFYMVPMKGQMGTDINVAAYREIVPDIREVDPDVIIIQMECRDTEDRLYSMIGKEEEGRVDFDDYRDLVNLFRDELRDVRQVIWIHDASGVSAMVALAWDELYMRPNARIGGLNVVRGQTGFDKWSDEDVRGKMTAAYMAHVKSFLEYGGYSHVLADAMVRPEYELSASFKGREVIWSLDRGGEFLVDGDQKRTVGFYAKAAEDLLISDGTADTIDDLALLMGFREYRLAEGAGIEILESYTQAWRRALENCQTLWADYSQHMGWAGGDDTLKWLGRAKKDVEEIIKAIDRYRAVEIRFTEENGLRRFDLVTIVEQLKERIRALRQSGARGGSGGRGFGTGGG